ncbi:DUF805 domain-containing protein [Stakelama pacifica]|uniref:Uncharacterized membrane protein YhaH (DUF805 family) n=1 Tax=Stakelama pacifica TaxID=517720 RepID=A0A4R6FSB6_9SPHN|nr:DUF805 domain-containing protein [Stakelama pacifica]MAX00907.1 hypothetical protein [Sphingomonas sp.]TDN84679.1 uncharacterized membrane protein YhaH (DUF805 family) [Stakelama pacifica]GGO93091.1 DUF805 domain-containing protein [Stakelama pacifica]
MYWMTLPVKRYFQMSGRSRRKEYWMFWLFTILVGIVAGILDTLLGFGSLDSTSSSASWTYSGPISSLCSLFFLIPSVTVAARRLHDSDRSAWWLLLLLIPLLGWFVLFIFMVMDGTRGANRFGPDPKDPAGGNDAQEVFG